MYAVFSFYWAVWVVFLYEITFGLRLVRADMSRLNTNEIQIPHDKHHKVSSWVKSHQNTFTIDYGKFILIWVSPWLGDTLKTEKNRVF